ncbi:hypothetical protein K431DRAFT_286724 [Polychaeton citri CBS 116435]|uniref:DUF3074 domain-containing protein n=1 Tax=Polychaeton citri CBS 116435 TaxID=1314669 RepID=A0A9P4Q2M1_9PEZI|nr:hypothetical protein K431DRAFT_286724 [Polychaeton citri CBS 116435]
MSNEADSSAAPGNLQHPRTSSSHRSSSETDATPPPPLGKLVRMRALKPSELPAHPALASYQAQATLPDLQQFVASALDEGLTFIREYLPKKFKIKHKDRGSHPSSAPIEVRERNVKPKELPAEVRPAKDDQVETWFARKSIHQNAAKGGTASWDEFDHGLREDHSQHEMEYTPDVKDSHKVLDWDAQLGELQHRAGAWHHVHMSIVEMLHHIPSPLNNRVFPVLVITAKAHNRIIVVQIPVQVASVSGVKYAAGGKDSKITVGMYCSIEYCELTDHAHKICWQMATASNAKGSLPMWAQKMGVPNAVVKDVGLFIGWTAERRKASAAKES